eukprot:g2893.t1
MALHDPGLQGASLRAGGGMHGRDGNNPSDAEGPMGTGTGTAAGATGASEPMSQGFRGEQAQEREKVNRAGGAGERRRPNTCFARALYEGWSALHVAAFLGYAEHLRGLLREPRFQADLDAPTRYGERRTPLFLAVAGGHADAVRELLAAGASVNAEPVAVASPELWPTSIVNRTECGAVPRGLPSSCAGSVAQVGEQQETCCYVQNETPVLAPSSGPEPLAHGAPESWQSDAQLRKKLSKNSTAMDVMTTHPSNTSLDDSPKIHYSRVVRAGSAPLCDRVAEASSTTPPMAASSTISRPEVADHFTTNTPPVAATSPLLLPAWTEEVPPGQGEELPDVALEDHGCRIWISGEQQQLQLYGEPVRRLPAGAGARHQPAGFLPPAAKEKEQDGGSTVDTSEWALADGRDASDVPASMPWRPLMERMVGAVAGAGDAVFGPRSPRLQLRGEKIAGEIELAARAKGGEEEHQQNGSSSRSLELDLLPPAVARVGDFGSPRPDAAEGSSAAGEQEQPPPPAFRPTADGSRTKTAAQQISYTTPGTTTTTTPTTICPTGSPCTTCKPSPNYFYSVAGTPLPTCAGCAAELQDEYMLPPGRGLSPCFSNEAGNEFDLTKAPPAFTVFIDAGNCPELLDEHGGVNVIDVEATLRAKYGLGAPRDDAAPRDEHAEEDCVPGNVAVASCAQPQMGLRLSTVLQEALANAAGAEQEEKEEAAESTNGSPAGTGVTVFFGCCIDDAEDCDPGRRLFSVDPSSLRSFDPMWTVLHEAVAHRNLELTKLLLEHGADPNARDQEGKTPLFRAAEAEEGADLSCFALREQAALALRNKKQLLDIISLLASHGGSYDELSIDGTSMLHVAGKQGKADVVRLLLEGDLETPGDNPREPTVCTAETAEDRGFPITGYGILDPRTYFEQVRDHELYEDMLEFCYVCQHELGKTISEICGPLLQFDDEDEE